MYEVKFDGVRCLAYLNEETDLRNKRNIMVSSIYPELSKIHAQVNRPCILDGELIVVSNGKPVFAEMQRRALMVNPVKIRLAAERLPVTYVVFDILWLDGKELLWEPLTERKKLLNETVHESNRLAISATFDQGVALYDLVVQQELEGIVAKRRDSPYRMGKRTKDWYKAKRMLDDDYIVCGYINKGQGLVSIVIAQYSLNYNLQYKGHVTMGIKNPDFEYIKRQKTLKNPPLNIPGGHGNERAVWIEPELVCRVEFMEYLRGGSLRQPAFRGLRNDKTPIECLLEQLP